MPKKRRRPKRPTALRRRLGRNCTATRSDGSTARLYVMEAEKAFGKRLPDSAAVHHFTAVQLVVCESTAYHMLLHRRDRANRSCGHPDWLRCWICHKYDDPENLSVRPNGYSAHHRSCFNARDRANRRAA